MVLTARSKRVIRARQCSSRDAGCGRHLSCKPICHSRCLRMSLFIADCWGCKSIVLVSAGQWCSLLDRLHTASLCHGATVTAQPPADCGCSASCQAGLRFWQAYRTGHTATVAAVHATLEPLLPAAVAQLQRHHWPSELMHA
jgi:CTP:molybdopterin cytidylyltransferase MocA